MNNSAQEEEKQLLHKTYRGRLEPIDPHAKEILEEIRRDYRHALKKSMEYLKEETRKFGGNPLPEEPGWEKYFEKIE